MTDALNSVTPGQPMSEETRAALAKSNAEESATAQRLAAEQRARDMEQGNEKPLVASVADSVLEKLKALPPEPPATV